MRKVITYGTFDVLHQGHVKLLERAKKLGDYLIVGVTADGFDRSRGKINVRQPLMERVESVRDTGLADKIIVEEYEGQKIDDIRRYNVDVFTVGSDWEGQFDYLEEWCEVVYLPRTVGVSSTEIRSFERGLRLGLTGESAYLTKFLRESSYVNGVDVVGVCTDEMGIIPDDLALLPHVTNDYDELLGAVDAVFVMSHPSRHATQARQALEAGVHALVESPVALRENEAHSLMRLAESRGVCLVESLRTAYARAYHHLLLLVRSGAIGRVVSIDATCTSLRPVDVSRREVMQTTWGSMCLWGPNTLLPIFQILGTNYIKKSVASVMPCADISFDTFSRMSFVYPDAVATAKVGRGVKSEGELIISGTDGYVYVPAPWWKTDYFEIRREDPSDNRRYFFQLDGEGIRDELVTFLSRIKDGVEVSGIERGVTLGISRVLEDYYDGRDVVRLQA